jgi:hypothetical protein
MHWRRLLNHLRTSSTYISAVAAAAAAAAALLLSAGHTHHTIGKRTGGTLKASGASLARSVICCDDSRCERCRENKERTENHDYESVFLFVCKLFVLPLKVFMSRLEMIMKQLPGEGR